VTVATVHSFRAEIVLTATLRHPNIVNFVGACWGKELTCLVLEFVPNGSLLGLLEKSNAASGYAALASEEEGPRSVTSRLGSVADPVDSGGVSIGGGAGGGSDGSVEERVVLRHGQLTWDEPLLRLATDVARGMAYLHGREFVDDASGEVKRGVLHRDLKVWGLFVLVVFVKPLHKP